MPIISNENLNKIINELQKYPYIFKKDDNKPNKPWGRYTVWVSGDMSIKKVSPEVKACLKLLDFIITNLVKIFTGGTKGQTELQKARLKFQKISEELSSYSEEFQSVFNKAKAEFNKQLISKINSEEINSEDVISDESGNNQSLEDSSNSVNSVINQERLKKEQEDYMNKNDMG